MELGRGLMIILAMLSLGLCFDVSSLISGGHWIIAVMLAGRIAAIVGIISQTRVGWYCAIGFFGLIIALGGMGLAAGADPLRVLANVVIPAVCVIYLYTLRGEFTR